MRLLVLALLALLGAVLAFNYEKYNIVEGGGGGEGRRSLVVWEGVKKEKVGKLRVFAYLGEGVAVVMMWGCWWVDGMEGM